MGQHPLMQRIGKGLALVCRISRRISGGRSLVSARSRSPPMYSKALAANSLCWPRAGHRTCAGRGPAADFGNAVAEPGLVASVIITDQLAPPVTQEGSGVFACTAGCEVVNSCLQVGKRCGAVGPDVGLVGFLARGQHADRGEIGCNTVSSRYSQRYPPAAATSHRHPLRPGGARDFHRRHGRNRVPGGYSGSWSAYRPPAPGPAGQR
jgi:hypothetical protein